MISETELLAKVPTKLFIGGEWVDSTSGRAIPSSTRPPDPNS